MASAPRIIAANTAPEIITEFASDVVVGLSQPGQKELPSKYLYDEVGSGLFDVICLLPEYGLSRWNAPAAALFAGDYRQITFAGGRGGTGQRQRRKNPATAGGSVPTAARELLPHRHFAERSESLSTGNRSDGSRQH